MKYKDAGIDIKAIKESHNYLSKELQTTFGRRAGKFGMPIAPIGHYAGLIAIDDRRALALHCDGVGTKILVAEMMEKHDTIGIDAVAMTVNDIICVGAEPSNLQDYLALSKHDPDLVKAIINGLRDAARDAHVAIVGGETAILPDLLAEDPRTNHTRYDLVTFGVGVVDRDKIILGKEIVEGDIVLGLPSSGFHSNGYTLLRKIIFDTSKLSVTDTFPNSNKTVGDILLTPTQLYNRPVVDMIKARTIHGLAHITGGAFSKLTRLIGSRDLGFNLDQFPVPPSEFQTVQQMGKISDEEMFRTFNMGIGMCIVLPKEGVDAIYTIGEKYGLTPVELGKVTKSKGVSIQSSGHSSIQVV
ncbi:MAG: phosphoribosylformylglycinamidine cyclo-ligase [Candidatus Ranarchaeia archaeon]|jgi:phosphoribosylformylglycinamidine cyclo-ligase